MKIKARALARKQLSLQRLAEGVPIARIADELNVTPRQVRTYLGQALEVQSIYATPLSPERVQEFRALEAERLSRLWQKIQLALDQVQPRIGSKAEKSMDGTAVARIVEAGTRVSERLAKLFGLDVPQKAIIETFSVNLERSEKTITISFDAGALEPPSEPIPGLSVWRNGQLVEGPGNGSAGFEPGFGLNGHVMTAGALPNALTNDSREDPL
jgi:hypothetical protein